MTVNSFDVIIVGGSYSGLAAGMALGRAIRKVLIIDSGKPCNRQTPHSHNFITQDGNRPQEITDLARKQVAKYPTIQFANAVATSGSSTAAGFEIQVSTGEKYNSKKLIFATGISDILPGIEGLSRCWGISVLHCPYCHGYEVRNEKTGIISNGDAGFEFAVLLSNWTKDLTLFTNGRATLFPEQLARLKKHNVAIIETAIGKLEHKAGYVEQVWFTDGTSSPIKALYTKNPFEQHCDIPKKLGCELNAEGYIKVDNLQKTSIPGIAACGDNSNPMRTVASAVASGTTAGMMINKELVSEEF